jgi:hypothetical protein
MMVMITVRAKVPSHSRSNQSMSGGASSYSSKKVPNNRLLLGW